MNSIVAQHFKGNTMNVIQEQAYIVRFDIIDRHTQKVVGTAKTRAIASQSVDKRDKAYGAYRFSAKAIWSDAK